MFTQDQIMHLFEDRKVMMDGHFLLSSGLHSDRYAQCARIFEYPEVAQMICGDLVEKLAGTDIDMVMGPAVGGILMAYEIARELGVPNVFAERVDGKMTLRRGFEVPKGSKVLLVEDVVTTGGSVNELFDIVEAADATVTLRCLHSRPLQRRRPFQGALCFRAGGQGSRLRSGRMSDVRRRFGSGRTRKQASE